MTYNELVSLYDRTPEGGEIVVETQEERDLLKQHMKQVAQPKKVDILLRPHKPQPDDRTDLVAKVYEECPSDVDTYIVVGSRAEEGEAKKLMRSRGPKRIQQVKVREGRVPLWRYVGNARTA